MAQNPPESSAERYRKRAEDLRKKAKLATSPEVQRELLAIALQYENLADNVSRTQA